MSVINLCFLPGTLPKPTLWAEPGSVVPQGSPVTFWCQGASGAQEFLLDKLKNSSWYVYLQPEPGDKVKYSVPLMAKENAGTYHCYYLSSIGWSEPSDPLELMVTGETYQEQVLPSLGNRGRDLPSLCEHDAVIPVPSS